MANLVIPDNHIMLAFRWSGPGSGSQPVNVLGIQIDPTEPIEDLSAAVDAIGGALVLPVCDSYGLNEVQVTIGNTAGPPYATNLSGLSLEGAVDAAPSPPGVAYLLKKSTSTPGRQGRGRTFLPGVDEGSATAEGTCGSAALTRLNNCCAALNDISTTHPIVLEFVIFHELGATVQDPSGNVVFSPDIRLATQRRRQRR